jgi:hypothetical protein
MARTKQTAQRSTGGLAVRHALVLNRPPPASKRTKRKKQAAKKTQKVKSTTPSVSTVVAVEPYEHDSVSICVILHDVVSHQSSGARFVLRAGSFIAAPNAPAPCALNALCCRRFLNTWTSSSFALVATLTGTGRVRNN